MVRELTANVEMFASVASAGVAVLLAVMAYISFRRVGSKRMLFIGLAFLVMAAQGVYLIIEANATRGEQDWVLWVALFELAALAMLYLAVKVR